MYKIIGADKKEYGPSTAQEIREWVAQGRANGQTLVQAEGSTAWKPLAAYPEFADLTFPAPASPPVHSGPFSGPVSPKLQEIATGSLAPGEPLPIGACLKGGWQLLKANFILLFRATFLVCMVRLALRLIPIVGTLALLFKGVFYGGLYLVFLKRIRNQPAAVGQAFSGFGEHFVQLLICGVISALLTVLGSCCFIIPGLYLFVAWIFAFPLIIDKNLGFWDAMELSRKVATRHWFQIFALLILSFLPVILFAICFNVVSMSFVFSLVQSGQVDFSLFPNNPTQLSSQLEHVSRLFAEKYFAWFLIQQCLVLSFQPFAKGVLMHAYEILFGSRPTPPA